MDGEAGVVGAKRLSGIGWALGTLLVVVGGPGLAARRPIVGFVYPHGLVEMSISARPWQRLTGRTAVTEQSGLRTRGAGTARVALAGHGTIALGRGSELQIGKSHGGELPLRLVAGKVSACFIGGGSVHLEAAGVTVRPAHLAGRKGKHAVGSGRRLSEGKRVHREERRPVQSRRAAVDPGSGGGLVGVVVIHAWGGGAEIRVDQGAVSVEASGGRIYLRAGERVEVGLWGKLGAVSRDASAEAPSCSGRTLGALVPLGAGVLGAVGAAAAAGHSERELSRFRPHEPGS